MSHAVVSVNQEPVEVPSAGLAEEVKLDRYTPYEDARHVVIDIETTGKKPGCKILSIGAYGYKGNVLESFYIEIDPNSCNSLGLIDDPDTMYNFWMKEVSREARVAAFSGITPIQDAIGFFYSWLASINPHYIWGNDKDFDLDIIDHVGRLMGIDTPWEYWQPRNIRTYVTNEWATNEERSQIKREINHLKHHALSDAALEVKLLALVIEKQAKALKLLNSSN